MLPEIAERIGCAPSQLEAALPLTPVQQGILYQSLASHAGDRYLMQNLFSFQSKHELVSFLAAVNQVITRHQALRTAILLRPDNVPLQVVFKDAVLPVHELIRPTSEIRALHDWLQQATEPARTPLDLATAPLLRAFWAADGEKEQWVVSLLSHHLMLDYTSNAVLLNEVSEIMSGQGARQSASRSEWGATRLLEGAADPRHIAYFREKLCNVSSSIAVPGGFTATSKFTSAKGRLDPTETQRLRDQSRKVGVFPASLCYLAWARVLSSLCDSSDVVFGAIVSSRLLLGADALNAIGPLVNTLPLRVSLSGKPVAELVQEVQTSLAELFQHGFAALSDCIEAAKLPAGEELFDSLLNFRVARGARASHVGMIDVIHSQEMSNSPLSIDVDDIGTELVVNVHVINTLEAGALVDQMLAALRGVVGALESISPTPVLAIGLLGSDEQARLRTWGKGPEIAPDQRCLHELIEEVAARQPDAIALVEHDSALSYGEVNRRANRIARALRAAGVQSGDFVGLHLERSGRVPLAMLATLKSGAAFVPMEPHLPLARLLQQGAHCGVKAILSDCPQPPLGFEAHHGIWVDIAQALDPVHEDGDLRIAALDAALAYVVYTSGSTGHAKGVMVDHAAMQHRLTGWRERFGLTERAPVVLQMAGLGVDISFGDLVKAWCCGGRLVMCPTPTLLDTRALASLLERSTATLGDFVPAVLRELTRDVAGAGQSLRHLEHVLVGSEAWSGADLTQLQAVLGPQGRCYNVYGQTESVIDASCLDLTALSAPAQRGVPMGAPLANTDILLLDAHGQLRPIGMVGELYIGGPGLAQGYLGQPALTARQFFPHAPRLYRTGDMARWRGDGTLEFLGRADQQVKINGFRIELGEIEAALAACSSVRASTVVLWPAPDGGTARLVAYVQFAVPSADATTHLRERLTQSLPPYMVPAAIVPMSALPLLDSGKVDRKALPEPIWSASAVYQPPVTDLQCRLAQAWADVLGVPRIGLGDNFFALGGDSIRAVRLVARCRNDGLHVSVSNVLEFPTLGALASSLREEAGTVPLQDLDNGPFSLLQPSERERINLRRHEDGYPLTQLQQGMVFHTIRDGVYIAIESMPIDRAWSYPAFVAALSALIQRHPILRTVFDMYGGERPLQWVLASIEPPLTVHDWRNMEASQVQAAFATWREAQQLDPDMFKGTKPLWRVDVHLLTDTRFRFTLFEHHAILDGWSVASMYTELSARFAQASAGMPALELPAPLPYREYVAAELATLNDDTARGFWEATLTRSKRPCWTIGERGTPVQSMGDMTTCETRLREVCAGMGVSPQTFLLAVHLRVLSHLQGLRVVTTSVVGHGRPEREGADLTIGMFLISQPFCLDVMQPNWHAFVVEVDRMRKAIWDQRHFPVAQAMRLPHIDLEASLFTYTDFHVLDEIADDLGQSHVARSILTNFRLDCHWHHDTTKGRLALNITSDDGLYDRQQIEDVLARFERALQAALYETEQPVCQTPLLSPTQLAQLQQWSAPPPVRPESLLPLQCFEHFVRTTPDAVAIEDADGMMSYAELERAANRIAQALLLRGVQREQLVALCLERTRQLPVAVLGVLKAGAAYLPLTPETPLARIAAILADAAPLCILADAAHADRLRETGKDTIDIANLLTDPTLPDDAPEVRISADQLAYVTYTSGSTGQPKGVLIEHGGLAVFSDGRRHVYGARSGADRWLQMASAGFDVFSGDVLHAFTNGNTLVICPRSVLLDPPQLLHWLRSRHITAAEFVPSVLRELCSLLRAQPAPLPHLRIVAVGADSWFHGDHALARAVLGPQVRIINTYGVTEASIDSTWYEPDQSGADPGVMVPIGSPFPGCRAVILDHALQPLPAGVIGELCLGGVGLARGYLNRPELTSERFITDPASPSGARLYRTGDLARWRADGNIELIGRQDSQVKIRGQRIELGEVEAALRALPGVRQALVDVHDVAPGDRRLAAWLVADASWDENAARQALARQLPDYMVPNSLTLLERLPLSENGKLDRRALPAPSPLALQAPFVEPASAAEQLLAALWNELLAPGRPISTADNFFALGGHSLLAMRLVAQLKQGYDIELSIGTLFVSPTLRDLASALEALPMQAATNV